MHRPFLVAIVTAVAFAPTRTSAQDVEMLGRRYGTTPPAAYYGEMARNPEAFRFMRGRAARMRAAATRAVSAGPALVPGAGGVGPAMVGLGPRDEAVVGDFYVPVVMGLFNDSPALPPVTQAAVQNGYFGPQTGTVSDYYAEVSSDSIRLIGQVQPWVRSTMTQVQATQDLNGVDISGLGCCGIGDYIKSVLDQLGPGVDWGAYDNDGPDGVPNSGDDDGYVDALAVIHPTPGAECPGDWPNRIWSHKWALTDASTSHTPYPTATASAKPGFGSIRVDDYFVQGAVDCSGSGLNEIGVMTHELGHAFGLPDLYDTRGLLGHDGAGNWDLMAAGTWGCDGRTPDSPCHMGAWSKAMLGWVAVDTLPADTDFGTLTLPPVETTGLVYRIDAADGSDEYFLLENRQTGLTTYDRQLPGEGLLVWQVDAGVTYSRWPGNTVNSADHMGVWLRQADGLDELGLPGGDRGDGGDPFPGASANTAFHAGTNPAARSFEGTAVGLSVLDISAPAASDEVTFRLITGFASMSDQVVDLVATVPSDARLQVQSGVPPVSWAVVAGMLPAGITIEDDGRVVGTTVVVGSFPVRVEATDGVGLTASALVTLDVASPSFTVGQLTPDFLLNAPPVDSVTAAFLDGQGNENGIYDLGDFRAWVLANPEIPLGAGPEGAP